MIDHAEERLLVVNEADQVTGTISKVDAHRRPGTLHRAFSLLVFSHDGECLLLQRRATQKVMFPDLWTNTCCSHPREGECATKAALRKAVHELNIRLDEEPTPLTRVLYRAALDADWEEYEMDHIVAVHHATTQLPAPNPEEVRETRWVTADELRTMRAAGEAVSPWFLLMCDNFLDAWGRAARAGHFAEVQDDAIHNLMQAT